MKKSILYKLTDQNLQTYNNTQWELGKTRKVRGRGPLCSGAWLHAYTDSNLAILLNPIHVNFKEPRLFKATGVVGINDRGLKVGCKSLTLVEELVLPSFTIVQRVAFGILCAKAVSKDSKWQQWADSWLDGSDRSYDASAASAASAAADAAYAARAADAAADAAFYAARAAARAADAAAYAAYAARAARAADAARAAARAADAAAYAALDLIKIAGRLLEGGLNEDSIMASP